MEGGNSWTRVGSKSQERKLRQRVKDEAAGNYSANDDNDQEVGNTGFFSSLALDTNADKFFFKKGRVKGQKPKKKDIVHRPKPGRHPSKPIPVVKPQKVSPSSKPFKGEIIVTRDFKAEKRKRKEAEAEAAQKRKARQEQKKREAENKIMREIAPKKPSFTSSATPSEVFTPQMLENALKKVSAKFSAGDAALDELTAVLSQKLGVSYGFSGKLDAELMGSVEAWMQEQAWEDDDVALFVHRAVATLSERLTTPNSTVPMGQAMVFAAVARAYPRGVAVGLIRLRENVRELAGSARFVTGLCWVAGQILLSEYPFYARYVWIETVYPVSFVSKEDSVRLLSNVCSSHYVPKAVPVPIPDTTTTTTNDDEEDENENDDENNEEEEENDDENNEEEEENDDEEQQEEPTEEEENDDENNEEEEKEEEEENDDENNEEEEEKEEEDDDEEQQEDIEEEEKEEEELSVEMIEDLPIEEMGRNYVKLVEIWGSTNKSKLSGVPKYVPALTAIEDIIPEGAAVPSKFFKRLMAGGNAAPPESKCRKQLAEAVAACLVADPLCFDYWVLVYHKRISMSLDVVNALLANKSRQRSLSEGLIRALHKRLSDISSALANGSFINHKNKSYKIADKTDIVLMGKVVKALEALAEKVASIGDDGDDDDDVVNDNNNDNNDGSGETGEEEAMETEAAVDEQNSEGGNNDNQQDSTAKLTKAQKKRLRKKRKLAKSKKSGGCCCCCFKAINVLLLLVILSTVGAFVWAYFSDYTLSVEGVHVNVRKMVDDYRSSGETKEFDKAVVLFNKEMNVTQQRISMFYENAKTQYYEPFAAYVVGTALKVKDFVNETISSITVKNQ